MAQAARKAAWAATCVPGKAPASSSSPGTQRAGSPGKSRRVLSISAKSSAACSSAEGRDGSPRYPRATLACTVVGCSATRRSRIGRAAVVSALRSIWVQARLNRARGTCGRSRGSGRRSPGRGRSRSRAARGGRDRPRRRRTGCPSGSAVRSEPRPLPELLPPAPLPGLLLPGRTLLQWRRGYQRNPPAQGVEGHLVAIQLLRHSRLEPGRRTPRAAVESAACAELVSTAVARMSERSPSRASAARLSAGPPSRVGAARLSGAAPVLERGEEAVGGVACRKGCETPRRAPFGQRRHQAVAPEARRKRRGEAVRDRRSPRQLEWAPRNDRPGQ